MNTKIVTEGGHKLTGSVRVSGAKNSALPILLSSILTDELVTIKNVPLIEDVHTALEILTALGKKIQISGTFSLKDGSKNRTIAISGKIYEEFYVPEKLVYKMRASILILGPLLARQKKVNLPFPGGCKLGERAIDFHIEGLKKLRATITLNGNYIENLDTPVLKGNKIKLKTPSVGATENLVMAATLAEGTTIIENFAKEPEVIELVSCLKRMGSLIIIKDNTLIITGTQKLGGITYSLNGDRLEAMTYAAAAIITKGDISILGIKPDILAVPLQILKTMGIKVSCMDNKIKIAYAGILTGTNIKTAPYPGFPTDILPIFLPLLCIANTNSTIKENIFENRLYNITNELKKLGANIELISKTQGRVKPVKTLYNASVRAPDIRAGAGLLVAALSAKTETHIYELSHIDRGYENPIEKLSSIGAKIQRL